MPDPVVVSTFVTLVENGQFIEALERFYHPAAIVWENQQTSRVGLDALMENERQVLNTFTTVSGRAMQVLTQGDQVAIHWQFEFLSGEHRASLDEVALQQWADEKIVFERFYYDPAQIPPRTAQPRANHDTGERLSS